MLEEFRNRANSQPQPPSPSSTSYYGGPATTAAAPPGTMAPTNARVRLVNSWFTDMTAVINGAVYTLAPGTTRTVFYPPGNIQYQVMMVADVPQSRTLMPGEELTLTLYPRREATESEHLSGRSAARRFARRLRGDGDG